MRRQLQLMCVYSLLLICGLGACDDSSQPKPTVVGKWQEQGGAPWEFTADGKAILKQDPSATYKVTGDNTLTIDFHNEQNFAVDYTFELSDNKLILRPENARGDGALPTDWEEPTVLVKAL